VYLARDEGLGRRVVVKLLQPMLAAGLSGERFRREVMVAAALQHPNIVPLISAGEVPDPTTGPLPYFIMPYVEGESLRDRLVRGPMSVRETVNISRDVVRALVFAHGRGIVHRDIKPGNILLSSGAAVVTDFGVAKALTASRQRSGPRSGEVSPSQPRAQMSLTAIGTSLGTPAYMAPEQAAADPNVDHRADIYALGVVMYEMLVGSPPFHGRTPQALLTAQLSEPPPPIAVRRYDVPAGLADLVMQCLEKDPARRPKSALDVMRALDDPEILSGAFASPPSTVRAGRTLARRVPRVALFGVPAIVALAAAGWWTTRGTLVAADGADSAAVATRLTTAPLARSVAVLPLGAVGRDAKAAAIAEGLTSELSSAIAGVTGVRVASQTAAGAYAADAPSRTARATPAEIGRTLGVALLLEGTVQREGEQLRIVLRIVDATADSTVWSRTFDGLAGSALSVQAVASNAVVAAFRGNGGR
jgi:serine/threonine-protein kinase